MADFKVEVMYVYVRAKIAAFAYNGFFLYTIFVAKGLLNMSLTKTKNFNSS